MKKLLIAVSILALLLIASDLPPALPSSFYGTVTGGQAGQIVTVYIGELPVRYSSTVFLWNGTPVYALDVEMDDVAEGTLATFRIGGITAGSARLYSGTNQNVDLVVPVKHAPARSARPVPRR